MLILPVHLVAEILADASMDTGTTNREKQQQTSRCQIAMDLETFPGLPEGDRRNHKEKEPLASKAVKHTPPLESKLLSARA